MTQTNDAMMIKFGVNTFKDLREDIEGVIECLEKYIDIFITQKQLRHYIALEYADGQIKIKRFSTKSWVLVKTQLWERKVTEISIIYDWEKDESCRNSSGPFAPVSVSVALCSEYKRRGEANEVAFTVMDRCAYLQNEIIEWFKEAFIRFEGIYGFLDYMKSTVINPRYETAWELLVEQPYYLYSSSFDTIGRGYFWGNILTEGHIRALGGEELFQKNFSCFQLEKLNVKKGTAYYVQISDDIHIFDPALYLQLKKLLQPILLQEDAETIVERDYSGDSRRINRLVFDEQESLAMQEASKLPEKELRERAYQKYQEKIKPFYPEQTVAAEPKPPKKKRKKYVPQRFTALENAEPENLDIHIHFKKISGDEWESFQSLLNSWADIGLHGGYDGNLHHLFGIWNEDNNIKMTVDMGSVDIDISITVLDRIVNCFAQFHHLVIEKMVLGSEDDE